MNKPGAPLASATGRGFTLPYSEERRAADAADCGHSSVAFDFTTRYRYAQQMRVGAAEASPQRPLDLNDPLYVDRPVGGGRELANSIRAGRAAVLVGGPVGVGKSTELAKAAEVLGPGAVLIRLDRLHNIRRLDQQTVLVSIARAVRDHALASWPTNSWSFGNALAERAGQWETTGRRANDVAREFLETVQAATSITSTLLIDGLERLHGDQQIDDIFEGLESLGKLANIAVVAPWTLAFGPKSETYLRDTEKLFSILPLDPDTEEGMAFLLDMLRRRGLGYQGDVQMHLVDAIKRSGGLPRTALQLTYDAVTYARIRRDSEVPDAHDFAAAIVDQEESLRRLLLKGDTEELRRADKTDGREPAEAVFHTLDVLLSKNDPSNLEFTGSAISQRFWSQPFHQQSGGKIMLGEPTIPAFRFDSARFYEYKPGAAQVRELSGVQFVDSLCRLLNDN